MHSKIAQFGAGVGGALLVLVAMALMFHAGDADVAPRHPTRAQLRNPIGSIDRLVWMDTAALFARGTVERAAVTTSGEASIVLADDRPKGWPLEGTWTSP